MITKMKVYEGSIQNKRDYKIMPEIKIKNSMLKAAGFTPGKEFLVQYNLGKITLILVDSDNSDK